MAFSKIKLKPDIFVFNYFLFYLCKKANGGFCCGGGGGGGVLEAREVVDGGAYGVELVEELVGDWRGWFGVFGGLEGGGEVVE